MISPFTVQYLCRWHINEQSYVINDVESVYRKKINAALLAVSIKYSKLLYIWW
jgi:hypothetical protein